jgi:hypothetical protein
VDEENLLSMVESCKELQVTGSRLSREDATCHELHLQIEASGISSRH